MFFGGEMLKINENIIINLYWWVVGVCTASIIWLIGWTFLKC